MKEKRSEISYSFKAIPRSRIVHIKTTNPQAASLRFKNPYDTWARRSSSHDLSRSDGFHQQDNHGIHPGDEGGNYC